MRAGQRRWDDAEPDCREDWIETPSGKQWLEDGISSLKLGLDVTIRHFPTRIRVSADDFICEFAQRAEAIYSDDDTYSLEWSLVRGRTVGGSAYQDLARKVAEELLLKHVDEAEKAHSHWEDCA
jgi:hypothetical protein